MPKKVIVGLLLAAALVIWIFVPGSTAGIVIALAIAAVAIGSLRKKPS